MSVRRHSVGGMTIDHVAMLAEQSALFNAAARRPDALRQPVSACPGWTVSELVEHLGEDAIRAEQKPTGDLVRWGEQGSASLVKVLRDTPPHSASWCWWNAERRASVAEVASRQAHEALIHRWDAEDATGPVTPAEPALWSDGVDEFATHILNGSDWNGPSGVVALRADDVGQEWRFGVGSASTRKGGRPTWLREARPLDPDALVSGTAEQLDLLLWRRTEADLGHVEGNLELFTTFVAWADLD